MEGTPYLTAEDVLKRAQEAIGIPMEATDRTGRIAAEKTRPTSCPCPMAV